jgi:hypothetical protein
MAWWGLCHFVSSYCVELIHHFKDSISTFVESTLVNTIKRTSTLFLAGKPGLASGFMNDTCGGQAGTSGMLSKQARSSEYFIRTDGLAFVGIPGSEQNHLIACLLGNPIPLVPWPIVQIQAFLPVILVDFINRNQVFSSH